MITFLTPRDVFGWVIVLYHPEKNFFPLLHIKESGLFLNGCFTQKLNRKYLFPRARNSVKIGESHKEFNTTYHPFFSTEKSFLGFTEDSLTHKIQKGIDEQLP